MAKKVLQKPEINGKETEEISNKIKQTAASAVATQKRQKEIAYFLDDLISKIVKTVEQTERFEEQAVNTKALVKELNKPSDVLKRINCVNIVQYLNGNLCMNLQTSEEETILNSSSILGESVEDCAQDVIENIIKNVESEKRNSGQSLPERTVAATEIKMGYIDTNGQVAGEEILKEMKMVQKIEQLVKNLINDVQETLDNNCSENDKNKSIEKVELPIKLLDKSNQPVEEVKECFQNPLSNASLDSPVQTDATASDFKNSSLNQAYLTIKYSEQEDKLKSYELPNVFSGLQESNMLFDYLQQDGLQQTNISEDSLQQASILTDSLQQQNISTDYLQDLNISTDFSQLWNISTDCLGKASISADSLQQSKSVDSIQLAKSSEDFLRASTQAESFQQASALTDFEGQTDMSAHSLPEEFRMDDYLKETIETAYQVLKDPSNISRKSTRAATLIKTVAERLQPAKNQTNQGIDNLNEIQNITEIIDGIGDLNEYLQMDIRTIFLEQRELKRTSSYILEHLSTIAHCRSEKFLNNDAAHVIKSGMSILKDIKSVKLQLWKLFRDFFLIQRSFLIHSLKLSSIPYELVICDSRYTRLMNQVKYSVIRMCGNVFGMEDLSERYEKVKVDYKIIVKYIEAFTDMVVFVDHKLDQRPLEELEGGNASENSTLKGKRMKKFQKEYEIFSCILDEIETMNDYYIEDINIKSKDASDIHCITQTIHEDLGLLDDLPTHTINVNSEDGGSLYTLNVLEFGTNVFQELSSLLNKMCNYLNEYNEFRVKFHNLCEEYLSPPLEQFIGSERNDVIEKSRRIYAEFFGDEKFHYKFAKLNNDHKTLIRLYDQFNDYVDMLADQRQSHR